MEKLSIRQKTWISMTIVLTISLVGILLLTHYLYERFYIDKQIEFLVARGELLAEAYYEDDDLKEQFFNRVKWIDRCSEASAFFTEDLYDLLEGGKVDSLITIEESQQLLAGEKVIVLNRKSSFGKPIIGVAVPVYNEDGCLAGVIFNYKKLVEIFEPFYASRIAIIIAFSLLLSFLIFFIRKIMNNITHPLEDMRQISEKMASGDFTQRIEVKSKDEIGSLATSFNILAATLDHEEQKKREFLSNVSHELRTPLSYIKGYTEAILDDVVEDPKKYIETINKESDRMQRLVNDLLDLAQLEGDSYPMKKEPLPFAQLIDDVISRYQLVAEQKKIVLLKNIDDNVIIFGDSDRLEQVISNLLDNALRYTPSEKEISISLMQKNSQTVELTIIDQGSGIPKESLPKLTERFYRVDKARSRKDGGTGLGLSIVAEILKKHNATLTFNSKENFGTEVKIVFPTSL